MNRETVTRPRRVRTARGSRERLAVLVQLTQRLAASGTPAELLPLIVEEARQGLGGEVGVVRVVEGNELVFAAQSLDGADELGGARPGAAAIPLERVALSPGSPVSDLPLQAADLAVQAPERVGRLALTGAGDLRSHLGVPVLSRRRVVGVLAVGAREADRFGGEDVDFLSGLAGLAAVALERAGLAQQLVHAERVRRVGEIVAGVAHELNNPLAAVIGTADILLRETLDPALAKRLGRISGQAQRAGKIVRALLTLARKTAVEWQEVDVNAILDEALELGAYELRRAHISVARRFDQSLPRIMGDPVQLQQVFVNLCLNASEAMWESHGQGTLILVTRHDHPSGCVAVVVTDDGAGIPPQHLARLFEPFFTTKGEGKGTGLGLAICRRIVEDHGGRITVESRAGAGASFTVELPGAGLVPAQPKPVPRPEERAARTRILVVEDEAVVGDLLAEFLDVEGHDVDRATNGREALERVRAHRYGLIVSDIRMPDVDGAAFYRELAAHDPTLARRVVFVTGDVIGLETRRFLEETGLPYLEKPFDLAQFQSFVRSALRGG